MKCVSTSTWYNGLVGVFPIGPYQIDSETDDSSDWRFCVESNSLVRPNQLGSFYLKKGETKKGTKAKQTKQDHQKNNSTTHSRGFAATAAPPNPRAGGTLSHSQVEANERGCGLSVRIFSFRECLRCGIQV